MIFLKSLVEQNRFYGIGPIFICAPMIYRPIIDPQGENKIQRINVYVIWLKTYTKDIHVEQSFVHTIRFRLIVNEGKATMIKWD